MKLIMPAADCLEGHRHADLTPRDRFTEQDLQVADIIIEQERAELSGSAKVPPLGSLRDLGKGEIVLIPKTKRQILDQIELIREMTHKLDELLREPVEQIPYNADLSESEYQEYRREMARVLGERSGLNIAWHLLHTKMMDLHAAHDALVHGWNGYGQPPRIGVPASVVVDKAKTRT